MLNQAVSSRKSRASLSKVCALAASAVVFSILNPVHASNFTWDGGDANGANGANGGSGTWDVSTTANWYNGTTDVMWADITGTVDTSFFSGTAGTVALASNLGTRGLVFQTAGYTITGSGTILIGSSGLNGTAISSGTTTINPTLSLLANVTWSTGNGSTFNLSTLTENTAGLNFTKSGGSTMNIATAAGWTGSTTINAGKIDIGSTATFASSSIGLNTNGEFAMSGAGGSPRAVSVSGAFNPGFGRTILTLTTDGTTATSFTAGSINGTRNPYSTPLFRGTNLGSTAGAGNTNIMFTTAPTVTVGSATAATFAALGTGTLNTTQAAVLRGALADTSASGNGLGFATYDPAVGVRLLNNSERVTTYPAANSNDNVKLTLTGATAFTGRTTNTLELSNTSGSAVTVTNTGTAFYPANGLLFSGTSAITVTGGTLTNANTASDTVILSTNTAGVTLTGLAFAQSASGERGIVFAGPGNITVGAVAGQASNGGIFVNGPGTVTLNGLATVSSKGITVNGGTAKLGSSFSLSSSRPFTVAPGGTIDTNGVSVTNLDGLSDNPNNLTTGGGVITNTSGTASTLTLSRGSGPGTSRAYSGVITGNINLVHNGIAANTGAQTLSGQSTYTGSTQILSGPIKLGVSNALPIATPLTITGGGATAASLDLAGFSQQVGSLTGAASGATITNSVSTSPSTLTINGSSNTTYASNINNGAGTIALVHAGTGTLALTATNTYSGGTTISGGTLLANATNATGTGAVTVNGGVIGGTGSTDALTVNSGNVSPGAVASIGTLTTNGLTFNAGASYSVDMSAGSTDKILSNNGFNLNGATGLNLYTAGTNSPFSTSGVYTLFSVPTGTLPSLSTITSNITINNPAGGVTYSWGISGTDIQLTLVGSIAATWVNTTGGAWATGTNWSTNPSVPGAASDTAIFGSSLLTNDQVLLNGNKTIGNITFNNSAASYDIAQGSSGTLTIDNGSTVASIVDSAGNHTISAPVSLSSNANLTVTGASDTLTVSGNVSGAGNINVTAGSGTVVLLGTNSYGTTSVAAGNKLVVGNGTTVGTLGTGALTVNGSLSINHSDAVSLSQGITGSGTVANTGTGTTTITGTNSGTWGMNVASGTVNIGTGGATVAGTGAVTLNGTLNYNSSSNNSVGVITGSGALNQQGSGTLLLSAASPSFSGPVTVTGGTLKFGASGSAGTGAISVNNATINENNVSTTQTNNIDFQGTDTIDTFGSTTMTLNGNITGNGTINRSGGTGTLSLGTATGVNGFTGIFNNTSGNVTFTHKSAGSTAAQWNFTSGTITLSNMGGTISFGALNGTTSTITTTGSTARVRVGDVATVASSFPGNITGGSNGVAILKTGSNSLTLSGQNSGFTADAVTSFTGFPVVVAGGSVIAGSSTTGATSGPLGGSGAKVVVGNGAAPANTASLVDAKLLTSGAVTVSNPLYVSPGSNVVTSTPYTLTIGGGTDNNSTFSGAISLMNNVTISQVATTGANHLTLSGAISGTALNTGPMGGTTPQDGPNNTGVQTVTFAGPGAITTSGVISNGTGTVNVASSGGTTTLSALNTYTGTTSSTGGKLITNNAVQNGNSMSISGGGMIEVPVNGSTSGVTSVSSMTTTGTGSHMELHDNDLVVNYGANPTVYTDMVNQVKSGLVLLGGTGTEGISSAEVDAQTVQGTILAVVDDGDANIAGAITSTSGYTLPAPASSVIVKFTWFGDSNLDGIVDGSDYALLDSGFTSGGSLGGWVFGDYDYSGVVDGSDYALIDTGFISQNAVLPEPTTLGLLGLGAMGMLRRRRQA